MPRYSVLRAETRTSKHHQRHQVFAEFALLFVDALVAAQQAPDAIDHDQTKDGDATHGGPNRRGRVRRANQHDDVGENAPARDVINRGARNGDRTQTAAQHISFCENPASTGKAVMLMAAPMNNAKLVKADAVIRQPRIEVQREKRRENKWRGNADMTGQDGGVSLLLEFSRINSQPHKEHEDDNAHLA